MEDKKGNEGDEIFKTTTRYVLVYFFSISLWLTHTNGARKQVGKSDRGDQHVEAESVAKDFGTIGEKGGTYFKGSYIHLFVFCSLDLKKNSFYHPYAERSGWENLLG